LSMAGCCSSFVEMELDWIAFFILDLGSFVQILRTVV
jgi:hypothetical protein